MLNNDVAYIQDEYIENSYAVFEGYCLETYPAYSVTALGEGSFEVKRFQ